MQAGVNSRTPSTWPGSQDSLPVSPSPQHPLPVSQTRSAVLVSCGSASTGASAPPLLRTQAARLTPRPPGRPEVSPRLSRPLIHGGCAGRGAGDPPSLQTLARAGAPGPARVRAQPAAHATPPLPPPLALARTRRSLTWVGWEEGRESWVGKQRPPPLPVASGARQVSTARRPPLRLRQVRRRRRQDRR